MKRGVSGAFVVAGLLAARPLHAGTSQQVPTGPRAAGMGGAFSAVVDDVSAMYWNPAGLASIGHQEIALHHADLFGSSIKDNFAALALPLSPNFAVGVDWYHSGYEDSELDYGENRFDLAFGSKLAPWISVGATGKLLTRGVGLDAASVRNGHGFGFDAGVLLSPAPRLRFGLLGQDLLGTKINYTGGLGSVTAYPAQFRLGSAYSFLANARVAVDVDDRLHVGLEYLPVKQLALRGGIREGIDGTDEGTVMALGTSVEVGNLRADYAYESHPVLGATSRFGLVFSFSFNPSQVRFDRAEAKPLFSSLYKSYSGHDFGSLVLRNLQDKPLQAKLQVFVPGSMDEPSEQQILLRPKAAQEVPLTAVFSGRALQQEGDRPVEIELAVTYQSARLPRTERRRVRTVCYGRGAIDWALGTDQAAAFVTTDDPVVADFARKASRSAARENEPPPYGSRNLAFTAAIFSALEELGVAYVPDPYNPFETISESERAVDTIHYPRETLARRTGDCDDTTVLLAALCGNVGIPTRFVDAPEHIFLLVDSGVHSRNAVAEGFDDELVTVIDDEVWIPLETTSLGRGFAAAWRTGAEEYRTWSDRDALSTVDVGAARLRYESAIPPGEFTASVDWEEMGMIRRYDDAVATLSSWRDSLLARRSEEAGPTGKPSVAALLDLASIYFEAGTLDRCQTALEAAVTSDSSSAAALNDLGIVLALRGDAEGGRIYLGRAREVNPSDAVIWVNLGILEEREGNEQKAADAFSRGIEKAGGWDAACRALGLDPGTGPGPESGEALRARLRATRPEAADAESNTARFQWKAR